MKTLFGTYTRGTKVEAGDKTEKGATYEVVLKYRILPDFVVERIAPALIRAVEKFKDIQITFIGIDKSNNRIIVQFKDLQSPVNVAAIRFAIIAAFAAIGLFVTVEAVYKIAAVGSTVTKGIDIKLIILIIIILMLMSKRR